MLSMASCGLGTSHVKLVSIKFDRAVKISELSICKSRSCFVQKVHNYAGLSRPCFLQKVHNYAGLKLFPLLDRGFSLCCSPSTESEVVVAENGPEEFQFSGPPSELIPNPSELESLLTALCETTSIAEFELKLNGFRLYVKRDVVEQHTPLPPPPSSPLPAPAFADTSPKAPETDGSISKSSVALTKSSSNSNGTALLDKAADEGLAILQSPRVGFFRRSRTIKGKRAPTACKEKQIVKEGQVLCYIDQLGAEIPVESDVSGEVVKILREDGEPVGYADALISILPSFPGIN